MNIRCFTAAICGSVFPLVLTGCFLFNSELTPEQTALMNAIRTPGQGTDFHASIQNAGGDVNFKVRESGQTPLMLAVILHDPDKVKLLLAAGADISVKDKKDMTALNYAAEQSEPGILKLLLPSAGKSLNVKDRYGRTPVMNAARLGNMDSVRLLLDAGSDFTLKDKQKRNLPMLCAGARSNSLELVKMMIERKVIPEANDKNLCMALVYAVDANNTETALFLLQFFPENIGLSEQHIFPALLAMNRAIRKNNVLVVKALIQRHVPLNTEPTTTYKILEHAQLENWYESLADVGLMANGQMPLAWAASEDNITMMKLLLEAGANPFCEDNQGNLPIDYTRKTEAFRFLKNEMRKQEKSWQKPKKVPVTETERSFKHEVSDGK